MENTKFILDINDKCRMEIDVCSFSSSTNVKEEEGPPPPVSNRLHLNTKKIYKVLWMLHLELFYEEWLYAMTYPSFATKAWWLGAAWHQLESLLDCCHSNPERLTNAWDKKKKTFLAYSCAIWWHFWHYPVVGAMEYKMTSWRPKKTRREKKNINMLSLHVKIRS